MCYNCGCEMPSNDMGNSKNITEKTFEEAAKAAGQTVQQAKMNVRDLLRKLILEQEQKEDILWKQAQSTNKEPAIAATS